MLSTRWFSNNRFLTKVASDPVYRSVSNCSHDPFDHRIEINRHFWPLSDNCRLRRMTFCWRFVLIRSKKRKKPAVKPAGGTSQDGVLMATMRCARQHARGHRLQRCRQRVGLLVNLFCALMMLWSCISRNWSWLIFTLVKNHLFPLQVIEL